ncbi:L-type lectin-domain containing receptor kinase IX.1-like [Phragmites australis]|uniref:L-type lectin-domain containing receptor kinase IX.1-like n=1 Tax=Phragmites australis TaxID=29695 RepID=UPI002D764A8F|nr:L-type lectin-domain containing receptor kinase IX.1-like [Phragmites australis]
MATLNLCSSITAAHQLPLLLVVIFYFLVLSPHVPRATSLSFSYDAFNPDDFRPEDDARVTAGRIELLGDEFAGRARGRAWHKQPAQLWDGTTGEAASFTASFNFSIQSVPGKSTADAGHGMTFFLAPYMPDLPQESYDGCLGLFDESQAPNYRTVNASGGARFVAVEFDIHMDVWDPSSRHIGVDVNSVDSHGDYTILPDGSLVDAGEMSATVVYDNGTRRLDVALVVGSATYSTAATVDLRSFLPEQVVIGFSAATGDEYPGNHTVLSFSFHSTLPTKNSTSLPATSSTKNITLQLSAGVAAAAVLVLLLVAAVAVLLVRRSSRRSKQPYDEEKLTTDGDDSLDAVDDEDFESGTGPRPIPYAQLAAATSDFAEEGKLGQGGSGSVYRGHLKEQGRDVAIKVFFRGASMEGRKEYRSEVTVISRLRHRNLVQLIGWCHGRRRLLLVYELVRNGSLDGHLYSKEVTLTWPMRYQIVLGLSSAVLYLHQEWDQCVVHGDIKPSNIMLDESFDAKLGDFGLARLIDHGMSLQTMTAVAGTPGYLDPECVITGKASPESDMYSFGVVLLEIACGRRPMAPPSAGEGKDGQVFRLVEWAWDKHGRGEVLDAADERLGGEFDRWEMERVVAVGLWCAHPDPKMRPGIRQAAEALRSRKFRMPLLPPKMPVAVYLEPFGASTMQFADTTTSAGSSAAMPYTSTTSRATATGSSNSSSPPALTEHVSPRVGS